MHRRVGDADPRNGPASLQRFVGEDLAHDSRHQQQCLANRMLWKEQQASHATAATALAADERNTALMVSAMANAMLFVKNHIIQ